MKSKIFTLMALLGVAAVSHAQTRSGRAAYHLSSRSMTTCARYEPVGSLLKVTNPKTGKTILVRVNGRGPYNGNRILDLSTGSFKALYGGLGSGHGPVNYSVVKRGK
ncbi:rare lipoprotein A [Abditibacterium utsteinense]|uniref:Rare lipoprotein A n=1 Tax=Abditibacterium utsteinense TaxID=1960156 RepID=A0A2S8SXG3_9BACT|nr:septal ring lytic transglycosylase RlpA family protein [Abditibacterium utsteinense]PQV65490.1 rare lipoprotein A [Abditibacterium utsteinense]